MKKTTSFILVLAFAAALPYCSFAWGRKGHAIVAEIAYSYLDTATRKAVHKYLGAMSLEEAGNWMDVMRGDHSYDYMKSWHYVNIEKGSQYVATKDDNIINALNNAIVQLEHKDKLSDEDIRKNLLVIFHLVGDLHQPLHSGYGSDKGGNDVQVLYLGKPANLHQVWDTRIIESENISTADCLAVAAHFNDNEIAQLKVIDVENWMHEPRSLLGNVYNLGANNTIEQPYVDANKKIIEQQLFFAGIRLASVLETVFKS